MNFCFSRPVKSFLYFTGLLSQFLFWILAAFLISNFDL